MPRSIRWIAYTLATVCLWVPAGALASSGGGGGSHGHPSRSADLAPLLADDWTTILALPAERSPLAGHGEPCVMLRRRVLSPELAPGAAVSCTVRAGTRVFLIGVTSECSDVEDPPFFAIGEAAQQQCARESDEGIRSLGVTIDDRSFEIRSPRFEVVTSQRVLELPEGNILTGTAGTASFSAHGWVLLTRPLRRGHHVLSLTVAGGDLPGTATVSIDAVARHGGRFTAPTSEVSAPAG